MSNFFRRYYAQFFHIKNNTTFRKYTPKNVPDKFYFYQTSHFNIFFSCFFDRILEIR